MSRMRACEHRWADEQFVRAACDAMLADLDWDSVDSGRLHHATSAAKTLTGVSVVVGVLDQIGGLERLLRDADEEKQDSELPPNTPVWLYVPSKLPLPRNLPETIVAKRIASPSTSERQPNISSEVKDAISELVEALLDDKHPTASWVERWSGDDVDPVQAAWDQSDAYLMMLQLLCHRWPCFHESATQAVKASVDACSGWRTIFRSKPIDGEFSPELTQWGARVPARLSSWLSDFVAGKAARKKKIATAIRAAVPTPPTLDALSWRFAAAYTVGDKVAVHGQAGHGGYYLVAPPALAAKLSDDDSDLGSRVREALSAYQPSIPDDAPRTASELMKPVLRAVGVRSNRQLQEEGQHCWIEDTVSGFVFVPTHNGGNCGDQRGFSPLEEHSVRLKREASDSELGDGLRQAFSRCSRLKTS